MRRLALLMLLLLLPAVARAQVYTANTTADSGAGSLRDAIDQVNADNLYTSIVFDLPSNSTISLTNSFNPYSLLRPASGTLTIDG